MKIESRFVFLTASLLAGCLGGWFYFETGDLYYSSKSEELSEKDFSPFDSGTTEFSPKERSMGNARFQPSQNETLYQHTSRLETEKAALKSLQISRKENAPNDGTNSETKSVKVTCKNAEKVLNQFAGNSEKLAESLEALETLRRTPVPAAKKAFPTELAESNQALFRVKDFSASSNPKLELSIADPSSPEPEKQETIDFQVVNTLEAQRMLSEQLIQQLPKLPGQEIVDSEMIPATINQAMGTRTELPEKNPTPQWAIPETNSTPKPPMDDLDENPIAAIMGLETPEKEKDEKSAAENVPAPETKSQAENVPAPETTPLTENVPAPKTSPLTENAPVADSVSQPTRIKKPARSGKPEETSTPAEAEKEYSLDLYRVDVRKALASFQIETGLKVVASLDVQGTVSCKSKNTDPEILLGSLLADTSCRFVRSGDFVYVAHSGKLNDLPKPLEKTDTEIFVPKHISIDELELVFRSNLTQFGEMDRTKDGDGNEALSVTDWVLSLEQLEEIQRVVDLPEPENRMNAFVFQRELNGTFKPLQLVQMAEDRGLVLQRMSIPGLSKPEEKKSVFGTSLGSKNKEKNAPKERKPEKIADIEAFSISYRADTLLVTIKNQLGTQSASMPGQTSAPMELNQPMNFDFNLNIQEQTVPYRFTITFRQNPSAGQEGEAALLADVICAPIGEINPKAKPKEIQFTLPMPSQGTNSLVFQLKLGEFPVESTEKRKNPAYIIHGNRMVKEAIVVISPYQQIRKPPKTDLSTEAIRELIRQQEVLARNFYGSLDEDEKEASKHCFGIAKRLRQGIGEKE